MSFTTINPSTEEIIQEYNELNFSEIENKLNLSNKIFKEWNKISIHIKSDLMLDVANILRNNKNKYAELMAIEMGKPITQGNSEIEKCAWVCEYYAKNAEDFLKKFEIKTEFSKTYISYQPLGTVLAIMPWNFPFWQVFRFAVPTLMAGNCGFLKHSRNTMGCAIEIENIFFEAGFPTGVFQNLIIGSSQVKSIIEHESIAAVTLTGSTPVGKEVASIAGQNIKKTVLELGGSDPYIILKDADLENTVESCVTAKFINTGQSCIAAKRFIVEESIYSEFINLFKEKTKIKKIGNPLNVDVNIGPMARKDLKNELHEQVIKSIEKGAKSILCGKIPDSKGYFYNPTMLIDVEKGMPAYDEEIFGPVASIIPAKNEKHAIEIANDSIYGLGAAIFTSDIEKGEYIAKNQIQAGACFVNDFVRSDPRLPFGGIKQSGYGRELSSIGIKEFTNLKTIVVK